MVAKQGRTSTSKRPARTGGARPLPTKKTSPKSARPAKAAPRQAALDVAALVTAAAAPALEPAERLPLLLDAWRARPIRPIRDLVTAVAALATASEIKVSPALDDATFDALDRGRHAPDLTRLLASLAAAPPAEMVRRFDRIARWPADPRIIDAIVSWMHLPPVQTASADAKQFWKQVAAYFAKTDDRAAAALIEPAEPHDRVSATTTIFLRSMIKRLHAATASVAARPVPVDAALDRAIAAMTEASREVTSAHVATARGTQKTEAELLAAVYDDVDDDAPRLVYADWLQEGGDPWGELVVLQLADVKQPADAKAQARIAELIAKHGEARYLGLPLFWRPANQGRIQPVRFHRGFAVEGEGWLRTETPALGDPRWGTFERLRVHPYAEHLLAPDPAKRALRSYVGLSPGSASELLASRPPRLEEVGFDIPSYGDSVDLATLERLAGPWLKSLRFEMNGGRLATVFRELLESSIAKRPLTITVGRERPKIPWYLARTGTELHLELAKRYQADDRLRELVALAWLLARSPVMLPIPGTTSLAHLEENWQAQQISLSPQEVVAIGA